MHAGIRAASLAICIAAVALGEARLGQKAAPLTGIEWIKGGPVDFSKSDGKHVWVVEFWATWCAPCRRSIPHLTELQNKYKDRVTIVGISDEKPDVVRKFVQQWGEKMDYAVATDPEHKVGDAYMTAFGIPGIPHAFVVDPEGRIVWHGHPMDGLDKVLEQVLAGTWSLQKAQAQMAQRERARKVMVKVLPLFARYFALAADKAHAAEARKVGEQVIEMARPVPSLLDQFAWKILTREGVAVRDMELARRAVELANKATGGKDPSVLHTYARLLFETGQKDKAIETEKKAIQIAKSDPRYAEAIAELTKQLKRFEGEKP